MGKENSKSINGGIRVNGVSKKTDTDTPLLSIVTVVYNGEESLEKTIESVINHNYPNIEFIIVDGGSTDKTIDIIKKYEDKIDYWVSEKDAGIYDAMNKGLALSTGEWIYYLGADDLIKQFTDDFIKQFSNNNNDVILARVKAIAGENVRYLPKVKVKNSDCFFWKTLGWPHQGQIIRREKHVGFDSNYKLVADNNTLLALYLDNLNMYVSDSVIADYSLDGVSTLNKEQRLDEWKEILELNKKKIKKLCDKFWFLLRKIQIHIL
jgi:glycosyltransferase involved in cell wall biosynthesis